jgi:hypothetical protein
MSLNGGADIISSDTDPTIIAVDASIGSLLLNTTNGKLYRKNDSGSSINWSEIGAGGGGGSFLPIEFDVGGQYSVGGSTQTEVMIYRVPSDATISSVFLFVKTAGSGGTLQVDIQRSTNSGVSWSSIFSTKPSASAASGSYFTATNGVISGGSLSLTTGNLLRLNIDSIQSGSAEGFSVQLQ